MADISELLESKTARVLAEATEGKPGKQRTIVHIAYSCGYRPKEDRYIVELYCGPRNESKSSAKEVYVDPVSSVMFVSMSCSGGCYVIEDIFGERKASDPLEKPETRISYKQDLGKDEADLLYYFAKVYDVALNNDACPAAVDAVNAGIIARLKPSGDVDFPGL